MYASETRTRCAENGCPAAAAIEANGGELLLASLPLERTPSWMQHKRRTTSALQYQRARCARADAAELMVIVSYYPARLSH